MMLIKYIAHEYTYRHMYPAGASSIPQFLRGCDTPALYIFGPVWDVRLLHIIALKCNNSKFEQKAKAPAPVDPKFLTSKIAKQISVKFLFPRKQPGQLA